MPVSLPPPIPPQLIEQASAPDTAVIAQADFRGYRVRVHGPAALKTLPFGRIIGGARSLSDAVYRLGASAWSAGYPAAQALYYADGPDGHDIQVFLVLGHLTRVDGDPRLARFFRSAVGTSPFEVTTLEPDRNLASVMTDRLGLAARPRLTSDVAGNAVMRLETRPADGVDALRAEFGNPGIRFVGRTFAALGAALANRSGDEFDLNVRRGLDEEPGAEYEDQALRWSRPTPRGLLAVAGTHVDFRRRFSGIDTRNTLWQYGAQWTYPVYADFLRRATLQLGVDRVQRSGETAAGDSFLDQAYTSADVAASYNRVTYLPKGRRLSFDSGLALRQGLGGRASPAGSADTDYFLARPAFGAALVLPGVQLRLDGTGQVSGDRLPKQQQWVIGGAGSLVAYLPGVGAGDSGYGIRLEARWLRPHLAPRLFVESAGARLDVPTIEQPDGYASAADAGAAVDLSGRSYRLSLAAAHPFGERGFAGTTLEDSRLRVLLSLQLTLKK